jgi:hypothetical protein
MKIKTSELTGATLDRAVAKAAGQTYHGPAWTKPSTDWKQGGPIIEREQIDIQCFPRKSGGVVWRTFHADGPTPLIAAMRCFVAIKLGDEVDVPDDVLKDMELDDLIYDRGDE